MHSLTGTIVTHPFSLCAKRRKISASKLFESSESELTQVIFFLPISVLFTHLGHIALVCPGFLHLKHTKASFLHDFSLNDSFSGLDFLFRYSLKRL